MNLNSPIKEISRLKETQAKALNRLGLKTVRDILFHFPARYSSLSGLKQIKYLEEGDNAVIYGKILNIKTSKAYRKKIPMSDATIEDGTGKIKATWFHQPYIAKMLKAGDFARFEGKVTKGKYGMYLANPEAEVIDPKDINMENSLFDKGEKNDTQLFLSPIYPESRGITSRWFHHSVQKILRSDLLDELQDDVPEEILKKYNLPTLKTAIVWAHSPKNEKDAQAARKRFAFEEIFFIQLERAKARELYDKNPAFTVNVPRKKIEEFTDRFPFKMTKSQQKSIDQILKDFKEGKPMSRLLEGDVGSGKTAVAAVTAHSIVTTHPEEQDFGNLQVAYMTPTEILANQQFDSFIEYFKHLPINIGLITSSGCKKFPSKTNPEEATNISRAQLLKWVANGEIPILVGTHSLISKSVKFKHLAYVVIDEQHRFGIKQRMALVKKDEMFPHLLSMTATPIPRTLALTVYGDLDLTLLDEMPVGRKPIITEIVLPNKRDRVYEDVKKELEAGRQLYVICPRINEPDETKATSLRVKSVKAEAERLEKDIFPEYKIEILHSKMTPKEKEEVMNDFADHKIDILVATSVVEVGVNVPNATTIIIEGAERFGLSQLHQLRGRVLRSNHQSYCHVFADTKTKKSLDRLKALKTAKNGFELSELDLSLRGAGELSGKRQWGISDVGMEAIKNIKMVEAAREEAKKIIKKDPEFKKHPSIKRVLLERKDETHFE